MTFLDAQRFGAASLLEIYYVILVIIYIPRLRSLWVSPDIYLPRNLWTAQYILTVLVAILESCGRKLPLLARWSRNTSGKKLLGSGDVVSLFGSCLL